jgi:dTDP-4-dehydrorhamnose reductase
MKTLILGAKGMLGADLVKVFPDALAWDINDLDITNTKQVTDKIKKLKPELVINAAAYTDVDGAEDNKKKCFEVNAYAVENLARLCKKLNAILVHFSTDYVFDGEKQGYKEDDKPNPVNVYGDSKALSEKLLMKNAEKYYLIRTAWLYGKSGRNFVNTITQSAKEKKILKVVDDQIGSPTYTKDLALKLKEVTAMPFGIYHITNAGSVSWFEFAKRIIKLLNIDAKVIPIKSEELRRPAKRPNCSILLNTKLIPLRPWNEALAEYLEVL